jgi:AraC family transcriptional activator of tynA and feaB
MKTMSLSTDALRPAERAESWRNFISRMIVTVSVDKLASPEFSGSMSARCHGDVRGACFRSQAHQVRGLGETFGTAGASGYLVSWQIEGEARVTQDDRDFLMQPGMFSILDGRRPLTVDFLGDVSRIVTNFPARVMESRLPSVLRNHTAGLRPSRPFAQILSAYLTELSIGSDNLSLNDIDLLVDNVSNLLTIISNSDASLTRLPRDKQRDAAVQYIRRHACNEAVSLSEVACELKMSPRLIQKLLQEVSISFTELLLDERLKQAVHKLQLAANGSVSSIAYQCGFNDISHFNHAFKRKYGMTPTDLRNASRQSRGAGGLPTDFLSAPREQTANTNVMSIPPSVIA